MQGVQVQSPEIPHAVQKKKKKGLSREFQISVLPLKQWLGAQKLSKSTFSELWNLTKEKQNA